MGTEKVRKSLLKYREKSIKQRNSIVADAAPPKPATKGKKSGKAAAKTKKSGKKAAKDDVKKEEEEEEEEEETQMKSVVLKGNSKAPVDASCPLVSSHHVYDDDDGVWDCMLNQTNISSNNNKFYLIQLLESDSGKASGVRLRFAVWMRWGRVGYDGQNSLSYFNNVDG